MAAKRKLQATLVLMDFPKGETSAAVSAQNDIIGVLNVLKDFHDMRRLQKPLAF